MTTWASVSSTKRLVRNAVLLAGYVHDHKCGIRIMS